MTRLEECIKEAEENYGVVITEDLGDILCDGDTCRHEMCFCWGEFIEACDNAAWAAKLKEMRPLYDAEVSAGIHKPFYEEMEDEI